jgi:hypothetical protein
MDSRNTRFLAAKQQILIDLRQFNALGANRSARTVLPRRARFLFRAPEQF